MSVTMQSEPAAEPAPASGEFEGEIREFIRKDVAPRRRRSELAADMSGDTPGENISMVVQRVAGASLGEIDTVIGELRCVRDFLRSEGDRVQREIAGYATLSQAAMASLKIISESMTQWRSAMGAPLTPRD